MVEHFRRPQEDFAKLFQFVAEDGLLVCGTNIYAGGDLAGTATSTTRTTRRTTRPQALLRIAKAQWLPRGLPDSPDRAAERGRKRYVLFTKSATVAQNIALYFGTRAVAPSE